ncbi:MAG: exonuclease SbcCD subunit D [Candidatus Binataceae bacterium]
MRIVHTSDWHAGRIWKSVDRLDELGRVLENLGDFVEKQRIDLMLLSGDIFDSGAPVAEAERLVFRFLRRVGEGGTSTVAIAGNHDNPRRLEAWGTLAELVSVHAVPRPVPADKGGVIELQTKSGECAVIAAVPFASSAMLVSALQLAQDETQARQQYAESLKSIVQLLCGRFRPDAVNLLMLHTHLEGALFSGSERRVHLGEEWAATPQAFPANAHYVALGHIHKPQKIEASPSPAYYAGSPLQLDFGEIGEEKSFVFVDARPNQPAHIERMPYIGGRPLNEAQGTLEELERGADRLKELGWLRVTVKLTEPDPDLGGKIRRLLPNTVTINADLVRSEEEIEMKKPPKGATPKELFSAYFRHKHGVKPNDSLVEAFERLRESEEEN